MLGFKILLRMKQIYFKHFTNFQVERLLKNLCLNFMAPEYVRSTDAAKLDPQREEHYVPLEKVYLGVSATDTLCELTDVDPRELDRLRTSVRHFYKEAVIQIQNRFTFNEPDSSIYRDAEFLLPSNAQNLQPISLVPIAKKFPGIQFDFSKLDSQWREQSVMSVGELETSKYWAKILASVDGLGRPKYFELSKLVCIFFSLPFSNAVTERLFSCLKNIKTDKRNRLDEETLSSILCVKYGAKRTKKDSSYFMANPIPYKTKVVARATASQAKEKRLATPSSTSTPSPSSTSTPSTSSTPFTSSTPSTSSSKQN